MRTTTCMLPLVLAPFLASQADMRDVVVTKRGKEVRGRVYEQWGTDRITVRQGGKRLRVRRRDVKSMTTVNDYLGEFLDRRGKRPGDVAHEWLLVEWAQSKKLTNIARLQAHHVILLDPTHERAHTLLGHRQRRGQWFWPLGSSYVPYARHVEHYSDMGHPLVLESLHFKVRTDAGLRRAIDMLFDLERLYLTFMAELGEKTHALEVLETMELKVWRREADFSPFTGRRLPYFFPDPNGDVAYTFYRKDDSVRPDLLLDLGVEHIIYHALTDAVSARPTSPKNRIAAWFELGLGQWFETRAGGEPGYLELGEPKVELRHAQWSLEDRRYRLANLSGLPYGQGHDITNQAVVHWATSATFVAFLMAVDPSTKKAPYRDKLLEFARLCYRKGRGSSSSLLDKTMGKKVEKLELEWMAWLERKSGMRRRRVRR